jgi:hypothetical protein
MPARLDSLRSGVDVASGSEDGQADDRELDYVALETVTELLLFAVARRRDVGHGWPHVATQSLVCTTCLKDPDAEDGAAGRRAHVRLRS